MEFAEAIALAERRFNARLPGFRRTLESDLADIRERAGLSGALSSSGTRDQLFQRCAEEVEKRVRTAWEDCRDAIRSAGVGLSRALAEVVSERIGELTRDSLEEKPLLYGLGVDATPFDLESPYRDAREAVAVEIELLAASSEPQSGQPIPADGASAFISHIAEDAAVAIRLKNLLRQVLGEAARIFVSSDSESIRSGADWHGDIVTALTTSQVVVILISDASYLRPWVNFEAGVGDGAEKLVIPAVIKGFSKGDLKPPLGRHHGRALSDPDDILALARDVAEACGRSLPASLDPTLLSALRESASLRSPRPHTFPTGSIMERLSRRRKEDARVELSPVVPRSHAHAHYILTTITDEIIEVLKDSGHLISIPIVKILNVYPRGHGEPWAIEIDGRVQWKDSNESWVYLPGRPAADDPLGVPKTIKTSSPRVLALIDTLRARGQETAWRRKMDATSEDGVSSDVVYDEDGEYLIEIHPGTTVVLVKKRRA